ncbi:hypothetical protein LSH36_432g00010 [Paralvinella palmiformis]|uniref:Methyltransferase domain-containing protein n=1 Tax=Paralvinella palmiformis TaxID=53620 RepID=A0AAD9JCG6_9ANNE|nr:hypothetical protein LSH36_432g00010 [Paralvinella palmiformis]
MGRLTDGGWDMCLSGPYQPKSQCLVYSFGISQDWSFDDQISNEFGCHVRAFDPYISLPEHEHSELVKFFPVGLSARNMEKIYSGNVIKLKTLSSLLEELSDTKKTIDFLKIDVEDSEWDVMPEMLRSGSLDNVKQLALELHTKADTTIQDYRLYLETLYTLESRGFKKWTYHLNPRCTYHLPDINRYFSHCQEVYYVNLDYLTPDQL